MSRRLVAIPVCAAALACGPVLGPALAPVPAAAASCTAADLDIVTHGHQDMALVSAGGAHTALFDETAPSPRDSGTFAVRVADSLRQSLAPLGISDLPDSGWVLPQVQREDVPWLGFNTTEFDDADNTTLTMRLHSGPGRVVAWQPVGLGDIETVLDSNSPDTGWSFPARTHAHTGFVFTEQGAYSMTFTYTTAGGAAYDLDVVFLVGDDTEPTDAALPAACGTDGGSDSGSATGTARATPTTGPGALAKDISGIDKAIGALDKELTKTGNAAREFIGVSASPTATASVTARPSASAAATTPASQASAPTPQPQAGGNRPARVVGGAPAGERSGAQPAAQAPSMPSPQHSAPAATTQALPSSVPAPAPQAVQAAPVVVEQPMSTLWAGVFAGIGAAMLLAGTAVLTFVGLRR